MHIKKYIEWYHSQLSKLFPDETNFEFETMNPRVTLYENNSDIVCANHLFLSFADESSTEWYHRNHDNYDLIVLECTPHELNHKSETLEWISNLLRDHGFLFYMANCKIITDKLVISCKNKTLGEIKEIYSLVPAENHDCIWQKKPNFWRSLDEIPTNIVDVPTIDQAKRLSGKELLHYINLYNGNPKYLYFRFILMIKDYKLRLKKFSSTSHP